MVEINMDKAIEARKELNSLPDTKVSFNDMVIKSYHCEKTPQVILEQVIKSFTMEIST